MVVKCTGDFEARVARDDGHVHTRLLLVTCATSRREVDAKPKLLICRDVVLRCVEPTGKECYSMIASDYVHVGILLFPG